MIDISIQNMSKAYFSDPVFENVSLEIQANERIAIIGENGTGKTTLFKIITGIESPSKGDLFLRKGIRIGYLKQVPDDFEGISVAEVLMTSFQRLKALRLEMNQLELEMSSQNEGIEQLLTQYSKLQLQYESSGGYEMEEKYSKICEGLKLDAEFQQKTYSYLSGGEKSRVCLAKLLLEEPDVILLDEPTNHLDLDSIEWLEQFLKMFAGSVLMISHDRYFLDNVVSHIYELTSKGAEVYAGNYSYYLEERIVRYEQKLKDYNNQQKKIKQMEEAVKRFKDWGRRGDNEKMFKKARSMEKRIEKIERVDRPDSGDRSINLAFDSGDRSGKEVIIAEHFDLNIEGRVLARDVTLKVFHQDVIGLIGPNGCGKSTLIKAIMNQQVSEHGFIKLGSRTAYGFLEQDIVFSNEDQSILDYYTHEHSLSENDARHELASFKFYRDDVFKLLKTLSGGERVRLRLAALMRQDINLLILDEPTNHIDIKTKEVLEEALLSFDGTLLFISHDRYFLDLLPTRILEMNGHGIDVYLGNYSAYKAAKAKKVKPEPFIKEPIKEKPVQKSPGVKAKERKANPQKLKLIEDEITSLEGHIEELAARLEQLTSEYEEMERLTTEIAQYEKQLEAALETWYELTQ